MKNMFSLLLNFVSFVGFPGFNFICCRLKNCLVYQKKHIFFGSVGGLLAPSKLDGTSGNRMKSEKFRSNLFCHWKSLMLLESSTQEEKNREKNDGKKLNEP